MIMMNFRRRRVWSIIGAVTLAAALGGCGSGGSGGSTGKSVKIVWWHNATSDPGKAFWQTVADEYHAAHPNVTIQVVPTQNEQFKTKIPVALQSQSPPDLFQQWGGGQLTDQVNAGKVMDLTDAVKPWIGQIGGAAAGWQVNGRQYGIPYSLGVVGFWYNKDLFTRAGIASPPATWDDLLADIGRLKAANVVPIVLGGKDRWPDAFYWDYLAVRLCSKNTLQQSAIDYKFTDPCWTQAGVKVKQLLDAKPFQEAFLSTPAQQGAGSSAGLLGNGRAAMELQGHWNPGVMNSLTPDQKGLGDKLGWFPFPAVSGGAGAPDAALGGGDGFSCSYKAPPECVDFLKYIASVDVQKRWGALNVGLPVTQGSESSVSDRNLQGLLDFRSKSSYVQLYLDIAYSTSVGQALDDATAEQFAGSLNADQVVKAIVDAAKNR
jgi:raffinose/stachyose/melibiose transport system substrate-binding protein